MLITFFRTLILYFMVVIIMRIMGKHQIGELQPYELVVALMISEMAAIPITDTEIPLINGIIPILTLLLAQVTVSYWTLKSEKARAIVCGRPSILIEKGRIVEDELRRLRMNMNDLLEELRVKNFPNISEVDYAILETNGKMSVIPKGKHRPVLTSDLGINAPDPGLPVSLIIDGDIIHHNLRTAGFTEDKLRQYFKDQGVEDVKHILYASIDNTQKIFWQKKEGL